MRCKTEPRFPFRAGLFRMGDDFLEPGLDRDNQTIRRGPRCGPRLIWDPIREIDGMRK